VLYRPESFEPLTDEGWDEKGVGICHASGLDASQSTPFARPSCLDAHPRFPVLDGWD
jgi:hypothetical protein